MNSNMEKVLIHPVDKTVYKETVYEDFVSREEFINRTGIFVSPEYFEYIYDMEFKESGVSAEEFVQDYEDKYSTCVQEIPLQGTFKYEVMDEEVNCVGEYDNCYEPNIWEIVNTLARNSKAEFDKRYDVIEKYNSMVDEYGILPKEILVLTEVIGKLQMQNNIVTDLLQYLIDNRICAEEITNNNILKDLWDISFNQIKMIMDDVEKNIELFRKIEQGERTSNT